MYQTDWPASQPDISLVTWSGKLEFGASRPDCWKNIIVCISIVLKKITFLMVTVDFESPFFFNQSYFNYYYKVS